MKMYSTTEWTEERTSELENRTMEIIQYEYQKINCTESDCETIKTNLTLGYQMGKKIEIKKKWWLKTSSLKKKR